MMLNNSHFVCENVNGFPRVYVIPFLAILKDKKPYSVEMVMWDFIVKESIPDICLMSWQKSVHLKNFPC